MLVSLAALQEAAHGAEEGFASPFTVNFGLFFWTWVVFILLFFVLKRFAWPPIIRATVEREHKITRQLEEAQKMNAEAKDALEEHGRLLANAKNESQLLINEAKTVAQREREQLLAKAREEQERVLERAKREIDAERERAILELRREAVDLSLAAASKLVQQRLDTDADRRIVQEYLHSLGGAG
jgi:F-type H+-transporting ATPase subunit b